MQESGEASGLNERQITLKLESFVKSHGAVNSLPAHYCFRPEFLLLILTHRAMDSGVIRNNENVLLDFGIDLNGL